MVRYDGAEARKHRIEEIARKILSSLQKDGQLSLSKTVAEIQYDQGLTKEKIMEYLEILDQLDRFVLDKDNDKIKKVE